MSDKKYKKRVLFIGIPDMALGSLDLLHKEGINIVGVIGPLKSHSTYYQFKNYVNSLKLNYIEYESLNSKDLLNTLNNLKIDIGVVASFNSKIPDEFLNCIKDGVINQHPSLLPQYRGGNPYSHVIINGDEETGITIHYMSSDFDKGDIIYQENCSIAPNETMGTIFEKTNDLSAHALLEILKLYENNIELPRTPQPKGNYQTAPNIKTKDSFINYNKTAVEIERFVRALNPFINALTLFRNNYIKVHKVSVVDEKISDRFNIGDIYKIKNNCVYIKTAKGGITLDILQYSSLFTGDSKDFISIVKPKIGEHFGI